MNCIENYPLTDITTMHLPVKCKYFIEYESVFELKEIINSELYVQNKSLQIGGGSNLVFAGDYDGIILHSKIKFLNILKETPDYVIIEAGAGIVWDDFVKFCISKNFYGTENLSSIPGEVGASAVQNIGSYGIEVCEIILQVHCLDKKTGNETTFTNAQCQYGYRDSIFKNEYKDKYIVTSVEYKLSKQPKFTLTYGPLKHYKESLSSDDEMSMSAIRNIIIKTRDSKLPNPMEIGSVGSFFKNPIVSRDLFDMLYRQYPSMPFYQVTDALVKIPAGWLIENAGLKGFKIGGAYVYEKQCLVIANNGHASSNDVMALCKYIIDTVKEKYGILLSPEANIIL